MTKEREGELLVLGICIFESLFPIVGIVSVELLGSIYAYGFTVLIATVLLSLFLLYKKQLLSLFTPEAQKDLLLTSLFITILFLLVFLALHYTTAGNVAVIIFMQLLFSYLYFNLFGKEKMHMFHTFGALLMGVGAVVLLIPHNFVVNIGDILALLAAIIAPIANIYQRRARNYVPTTTILTYRNLVALPFIFLFAVLFEEFPSQNSFIEAVPYLLFNGMLVYVAAKVMWIEALHRISITKMSAMLAFSPVFTLLFAYLFLGEALELKQFIAMGGIIFGSLLLTKRVV